MQIGIGLGLTKSGSDGLSAQARAALENIPNATSAEKAAVARYVDSLATGGVWDRIDAIGIHALSDNTDKLANLKGGAAYSRVNTSKVLFVADGIQITPGTGYLQAPVAPHGIDDELACNYVVSSDAWDTGTERLLSSETGSRISRVYRVNATTLRYQGQQDGANYAVVYQRPDIHMFVACDMRATGQQRVYIDGRWQDSDAETSTVAPTDNWVIGNRSDAPSVNNTYPHTTALTLFGAGIGITADDHRLLENAARILVAELGVAGARLAFPVVLGDSWVNTAGNSHGHFNDWYSLKDDDVVDGVSGRRMSRFNHPDSTEKDGILALETVLDEAFALSPSPIYDRDSLIIALGINDFMTNSDWTNWSELQNAMIEQVRVYQDFISTNYTGANHSRNVRPRDLVVVGPGPIGAWGSVIAEPERIPEFEKFIAWVPGFCARHNIEYVDVYNSDIYDPETQGIKAEYQSDGGHINDSAAENVLAPLVDAAIERRRTKPFMTDLAMTAQTGIGWNDPSGGTYEYVPVISGADNETVAWNRTADGTGNEIIYATPVFLKTDATKKIFVRVNIDDITYNGDDTWRLGWAGYTRESTGGWDARLSNGAVTTPVIRMFDSGLGRSAKAFSAGTGYGNSVYHLMQEGSFLDFAIDLELGKGWVAPGGMWHNDKDGNRSDPATGEGGFDLYQFDTSETGYCIELGTEAQGNMTLSFASEIPAEAVPSGFSVYSA